MLYNFLENGDRVIIIKDVEKLVLTKIDPVMGYEWSTIEIPKGTGGTVVAVGEFPFWKKKFVSVQLDMQKCQFAVSFDMDEVFKLSSNSYQV